MSFNNAVPLAIIIFFVASLIAVGKIASKRIKNTEDYLVASRGAPLFLVVGTVFATFWGGGTIVGGTGAAFEDGVYGVIEDPFAAGLSLIIIGLLFVKTLRGLKINSIGEIYTHRFGSATGYVASAVMIPTFIIWTAVQLLAVGKILSVLFDLNFYLSYVIALVVVVSFTYMGGLLAVIWTDFIQMIIIFVGLIILLVVGYNAAGGIENIAAHTPDDFWQFIPSEKGLMPWVTYVSMWAGMALGNIPSPDIAQRALMAKDAETAQKGMIISGSLYWTFGLIPVFLALIGHTLISSGMIDGSLIAQDSELLIPFLAKELLNPVLLGIFVASLIGAVLSSASTSLFATAVIFSNDIIYPIFLKDKKEGLADQNVLMRITRYCVVLTGILAALVGLLSSNIYDMTIFAFTLQFGVLFFPFIIALKSKWATSYGIMAGMLGGLLVNVLGGVIQGTIIPEPWEFFTLVPPLVNILLIVTVSLFTKKSDQSRPLDDIYI
ncbi:hypothetical protein [Alkalibacterium sp. 20]|uniref:sodium:solute symporter family transporter n=1 Tax=Alkalibacterium sp. 20 TaxID=1798803 RepID=UPI0009003A0F|nr:hypothetical protein [Alkalibacterium sp. 20]OJF92545.1 hypothetical protein AX762_09980 [Alkalibacterium sp. 20]